MSNKIKVMTDGTNRPIWYRFWAVVHKPTKAVIMIGESIVKAEKVQKSLGDEFEVLRLEPVIY